MAELIYGIFLYHCSQRMLAVAGFLVVKDLDLLWWPVAIVAALSLLVPLPVYAITTSITKSEQEIYHEYWNGFETAAISDKNLKAWFYPDTMLSLIS